MKRTLLEAVNRRFSNTEDTEPYSVATLEDPRYKDRYFTGAVSAKLAEDALLREIRKMERTLNDGGASATQPAVTEEDTASATTEPADKMTRLAADWRCCHPGPVQALGEPDKGAGGGEQFRAIPSDAEKCATHTNRQSVAERGSHRPSGRPLHGHGHAPPHASVVL
ncbi:uncharacterized protein LOC115384147 [Salarias fasciatus]|uniref:uncharacterized protein LOC115384147 n=1 Tax=Salarias fasciatus TaxID=181472 RepID=UPI00117693C3|nr:uncharacterized protein LOC115384147 [Salarias fasciatus]